MDGTRRKGPPTTQNKLSERAMAVTRSLRSRRGELRFGR